MGLEDSERGPVQQSLAAWWTVCRGGFTVSQTWFLYSNYSVNVTHFTKTIPREGEKFKRPGEKRNRSAGQRSPSRPPVSELEEEKANGLQCPTSLGLEASLCFLALGPQRGHRSSWASICLVASSQDRCEDSANHVCVTPAHSWNIVNTQEMVVFSLHH